MRTPKPAAGGKLRLIPLVAATYFMVSGGPYGLEELVRDSGYEIALAILLLTPLIWSLPTALMVGELAAAIPCEGGFYIWVRRAMGPFWGFQEAWLSLTASVFDMAAYPTVFVMYLGRIWAPAKEGHNGVIIAALVIFACMFWNLFGAKAVGDGSVLLGALLLSPFVLITIFALFRHTDLSASTGSATSTHPDLLAGIIVAMWNYMGWDNASTVAEEVENPQRTYPRVMMITLAAIVISYAIPVFAVSRTHVQPSYWATGAWADIGAMIVAPWLGLMLVMAAMISAFGSLNSLTMSLSRLPAALSEDGYAPALFRRKLANGAPWAAIAACGLAWTAVLGLSFDRMLMLDILLYGASLVLEFIALVLLRIREPELVRPFRIPGGLAGAICAGVGPTALLMVALIRNHNEQMGNISALTVGLIIMAAGVGFYFIAAWRRQHAPGPVAGDVS
ncbi:MAG TPA: APC family permease [Bryobacteraceae bacterium]|nr:APC family permease [Bryobacteraceae bacterium]